MIKFKLQFFAETNKETFVRQMNELADAINTKAGSSGSLTIAGMKTAVENLSTATQENNLIRIVKDLSSINFHSTVPYADVSCEGEDHEEAVYFLQMNETEETNHPLTARIIDPPSVLCESTVVTHPESRSFIVNVRANNVAEWSEVEYNLNIDVLDTSTDFHYCCFVRVFADEAYDLDDFD